MKSFRPPDSALPLSRIVLLVAGGTGQRMGTAVPKQFLPLAGEPVLLHTLRRFAEAAPEAARFIILPAAEHAPWQTLVAAFPDVPPHQIVAGGATRLTSVRAGLAALATAPAHALVAIHDGVRPLVPGSVIRAAYQTCALQGTAVAVVPLKDSVRHVLPGGASVAADRAAFRLVQTPQCFSLGLLREAYLTITDADAATLTDDASVVERLGYPIELIAGDYRNLKITTPEDLLLAEAFLRAGA